ncbi:MAG: MaoC domain protein dehydratase [Subtercola sp.]|nr:MaoC domain protein dehydratase [Subtercola sp.]
MIANCTPESAQPGGTFSAGLRSSGFAEWNRFAAVNDEFIPLHMGDEAGRVAGYPGAIAMGRLQWSWAHNLLRAWLGTDGRIASVSMQFRRPLLRDAMFDIRAHIDVVRLVDTGDQILDLTIGLENESGEILAPGTATLHVFTPGGSVAGSPQRAQL